MVPSGSAPFAAIQRPRSGLVHETELACGLVIARVIRSILSVVVVVLEKYSNPVRGALFEKTVDIFTH
jgi:hypothetical protein